MFKVNLADAQAIPEAEPTEVEILERAHLQEWVLKHPQILGQGVQIVASEFDRWRTAAGDAIRDRLDVLGIDGTGRLVLAELKVGTAPHTVQMQAINYAAMVSRLKPRDVAELYVDWRSKSEALDIDSVLDELTTKSLMTEESIRNPRIVLIASRFPASVTASVVWLNEREVDISLVRYRAYKVQEGAVVVTFSRFFPVPTVEEFTIGRHMKSEDLSADDPGGPWDVPGLTRLSTSGNTATLTLMDLCADEQAAEVTVLNLQEHAGLSTGQVRGQLAGLTMMLKNPRYGFSQKKWPVTVTWTPAGTAAYSMDPDLALMWRSIRSDQSADAEPSATLEAPSHDI